MTYQQIAQALDLPQSSAQVRASQHRRLVNHDPVYARRTAELAAACFGELRIP